MFDAWSSFHFLRPGWLWTAVPAVVLAVLHLRWARTSDRWKRSIAPHLVDHLVTGGKGRRWGTPGVWLAPLAVVLAVAMAGPSWRLSDDPAGPDDTTLVVVVDLSSSMSGADVGPSRAGRLRLKLRDLLELRRGGRTGLVAVAGTAHVVMPPTDDVDVLTPYVDVLDPDLMTDDGEAFEKAARLVDGLVTGEDGPTVVLVAADAIPPRGADALAGLAERRGVKLVGWAVGTAQGIPGAGVPPLDRTGFARLERAGADVVDLRVDGADLRRLDRLFERERTASADVDDAALWEDGGYAFVVLFALGLTFWFRRGWVVGRAAVALALVAALGGCESSVGDAWLDLWLTRDQQGRRLFERGEYAAAAERFEDPMWKGVAYYAAHDWAHAQQQFARVDDATGLYDLGNAHAQAKEIVSAIAAYDRVLERMPTHRAARANRDLMQRTLEGLTATSDTDDRKRPPPPLDPTAARLDEQRLDAAPAADLEAFLDAEAAAPERALSAAEDALWMERVSTTPADFLRNKFARQAAEEPGS